MKSYFLIKEIFRYINRRRKFQLFCCFILILLSGIADMVSIASVIPFLKVILNPDSLLDNQFIIQYTNLNEYSYANLLLILTIVFILCSWISTIIRLTNLWFYNEISAKVGCDIGAKAFQKVITLPYSFHLKSNSSNIINLLTFHIDQVTYTVRNFFQIVSFFIISICIITLLMIYQFKVTFSILSIILFSYTLIVFFIKPLIIKLGVIISNKKYEQLKLIQESLGGIKQIILDTNQSFFIKDFYNTDLQIRKNGAKITVFSLSPRFLLEALAITTISLITYSIIRLSNNPQGSLSIIGVIALGSQRLLPCFQGIYSSWSTIRGFSYGVEQVLKLLEKKSNFSEIINSNFKNSKNNFQKIELKNVYFKYPKDDKFILKNINFTIHKGDKIGIIGTTGCGKSTLLNILMGLIKPYEGELLIDNKNINNNIHELLGWYLGISHVPQSIFLTNKSFVENIAFGLDKNDIKMDEIKKASEDSLISEFIENKKEKYFSLVGEQGKNLSNGQRQRIGIARAFYKKSNLLILDEATSALDNETEKKLMNNIDLFKSNITIIIVAHRLSSLKYCDRIIEINDGQIIKESTPKELNIN